MQEAEQQQQSFDADPKDSESARTSLLVVLATGGTGGHIFPAESLAEELMKRGHKPVLMTDKRFDERYQGVLSTIEMCRIESASPSGNIVKKIKGVAKLFSGVLSAGRKMHDYKPDVVVGFGGYPSFPPVYVASRRKIPTILHEQNAVLGKVNKFLAADVTRIATSFPIVSGIKDSDSAKISNIGNPVRARIRAVRSMEYPNFDNGIRLLVTGGSQGAAVFADIIPKAIKQLPESLRNQLHIVQQCHKNDDSDAIREEYQHMGVDARVSSFFQNMNELIAQSHLVICRSGASTVTELMVAGRPAIMVPYPYATGNHQYFNAKGIEEKHGGWIFDQSDFTVERLHETLEKLFQDKESLPQYAKNMKSLGIQDSAKQLADMVEEIA
ncbi:MAG: undecaprenyldiphospho-muramoylpentapeptide beta-N-acetylglucosaminyltransferase [Rickettsiales bacterium]|nr:undecaprenyldiphospho-muramoylpentapeptide beta-N-acetylglucosaminyltransferase [Rickettsiales bacterium]